MLRIRDDCVLTLRRNARIGTESEAVLHGAEDLDEVCCLVRDQHVLGLPPRLERESVVVLCGSSKQRCTLSAWLSRRSHHRQAMPTCA